jgi:sulfane dehydrogenase subunit SoxC
MHGKHGSVLEADLRHPGRSLGDCGGERATHQEGPGRKNDVKSEQARMSLNLLMTADWTPSDCGPEQGYPVRLVVPGWEGNVCIKWLHRLHLVDQPSMTREEAAGYTDLMPDGKARMFTFVMEAKSVITRPSGEQTLPHPGFYEISGLAWSGRGRIERVEVATDGGQVWQAAELQEPRLTKAFTRFRLPWTWDGKPTTLQSRCVDETGYVQPTHDELLAIRGKNATDHYNGIKVWRVFADGKVTHV